MLARAKRDYYAVLGVPPDAGREEIKRAFRSLAGEWHPDVSPNPDAAATFQAIAEAYEVLSRPESRARYDRVHAARRSAGGHRRRGTVRVDVTAPGVPGTRPGERGPDVAVELHLTYREAARGTVRSVRYEVVDACPRCLGTGRTGARGCLPCGATGLVDVARTVTVRIAPATLDGAELRYPGDGSPGGRGAGPGDLVVTARVRPLPDSQLVRRLAASGVACALGLGALVTLLQ